jgi:hypothetical protein
MVLFETNAGRESHGRVIQILEERKGTDVLLIERPEDGWRVFRLESEVSTPRTRHPSDAPKDCR